MTQIFNIPAGTLPGDFRKELMGIPETRKVVFTYNGQTFPFSALSRKIKSELATEVINDPEAMRDLRGKGLSLSEALEEYAYCMYGAVDSNGDINEHGELQPSENFRCSDNCRCLRWKRKQINIDGRALTPREIEVIDMLRTSHTDEVKAQILGMSRSTLNTHKKNLFTKFNVLSATSLILKAIDCKVIG